MTTTNVVSLDEIGARLRGERERLGCSQETFGGWGGVTRNTQQAYEAGRRAFDAMYLAQMAEHGIDVGFLLTGAPSGDRIDSEAAELLNHLASVGTVERHALLTLAASLAGRDAPRRLHAPTSAYGAPPAMMPSEPALARALEGFLQVYSDLSGDALARALARHIPSVIEAAGGPPADRSARAPAPAGNPADSPRAQRQGQRT